MAHKQNAVIERCVVMSDLHIPFHDKKSVALVLSFVKKFRPDVMFLNGDIIDCFNISAYTKHPATKESLRDEIDETRVFLADCRKAVGDDARIIYVQGNHEYRLQRFLAQKARELFELEGLTLAEQLHFKDLGIQSVEGRNKENYVQYGNVFVGHWDKANKWAGYTAKGLVEDKGVSIIQGHTHKVGMHTRRRMDGTTLIGVEYGCLCDLNPQWINTPAWTQGICVLYKNRKTNVCHVQVVQILDHEFVFDGVLWKI